MIGSSDLEAIVREGGIPTEMPLSLAACGGGAVFHFASGMWPDARPVIPDDLFYAGSLTKQLTGAAVALLARDGRLDVDAPLGQIIGGQPDWADHVTGRHLLYHIGGLPAAGVLETQSGGRHWTNGYVMAALQALKPPYPTPGISFAYSNAGYVCIARIVEQITGMSFDSFVEANLIARLGIEGMHVLSEGEMPAFPQVAMMGPALPLSTGDGGLWTTASAYLSWLDQQNHDALGIASLVEQPGKLADGEPIAYGWGVGIRTFEGQAMFIHAGGWQGAYAKAIRSTSLGLSVAGFAADHSADRVVAVTDAIFARLAGDSSPRTAT